MKKKLSIGIISLMILSFTGCSSFFLQEDEPVISEQNNGIASTEQSSEQNGFQVASVQRLTEGIVYDISSNGSELLVGTSTYPSVDDQEQTETSYINLGLYRFDTNQTNPLLETAKNQVNGILDDANNGYYYLEFREEENETGPYRLVWSDLDGSVTRNLSDSEESVSPVFSMYDKNRIIYGNQRGQVKLLQVSELKENRRIRTTTYQLSENMPIDQINYLPNEELAVFSSRNEESGTKDLYYAYLNGTSPEPVLVRENIRNFSLSPLSHTLLYTVGNGDNVPVLNAYDLREDRTTTLYEGNVGVFRASPDGNVVFSERPDSSSTNQNLWIVDLEGNNLSQIASNLNVAGNNIVFSPSRNDLYLTVFSYAENEEDSSEDIVFHIYQVTYE